MARSVLFSTFARQVYLYGEAGDIVETILRDIAIDASRRGQEFVVMRIPTSKAWDSASVFWFRRNYERVVTAHGGRYLDATDEMTRLPDWVERFCVPDGHMSPEGDRFLADFIYRHVFARETH
jgi:hypothetical protein